MGGGGGGNLAILSKHLRAWNLTQLVRDLPGVPYSMHPVPWLNGYCLSSCPDSGDSTLWGCSTLNEFQDTSEWIPLNLPADVRSEGWVEPSGALPCILPEGRDRGLRLRSLTLRPSFSSEESSPAAELAWLRDLQGPLHSEFFQLPSFHLLLLLSPGTQYSYRKSHGLHLESQLWHACVDSIVSVMLIFRGSAMILRLCCSFGLF